MGTTNTLDLNNRISALEKGGGGGTPDGASRADIATEFDATKNYTAGCFVYYEGKLYQFNADHSAGEWDPTDVVEANVTDQVTSNAAAIAAMGGGVTTQHLTGLRTDTNGCIYLDLAVDSYILVGATTKDFSAMYGPFVTIGIWQEYGTYKYMLRLTDSSGAAKASSNYWIDIHYMEREV